MRLKLSHVLISAGDGSSGSSSSSGGVAVSGVSWTASNECLIASDSGSLCRLSLSGSESSAAQRVCGLDFFVTAQRWLSTVRGGGAASGDCLALGCSDGSYRLLAANGRLEKAVAAHTGSVLCLSWSADGSSLVTGGEDGAVKQWSRSGNLRSRLAAQPEPVTSVCWAPDQQRIAFTHGNRITVQQANSGAATGSAGSSSSSGGHHSAAAAGSASFSSSSSGSLSWVAHSSAVLCCDWHPVTGALLTGGEDGCYRLWSEDGELLFSSRPLDFAVSSLSWSPSGRYFAVGAFNLLALCDAAGWSHSRHRCSTGSVLHLDWSADGCHLAAGGANGCVAVGQLVERQTEWRQYSCRLRSDNCVLVQELSSESLRTEELDFAHSVVDWSFGFGQLVVTTAASCQLFAAPHFASAHCLELRRGVELILQSASLFALLDCGSGVQLFSYDGKQLGSCRLPAAVRAQGLHANTAQLCGQLLCLAAPSTGAAGGGCIHVMDLLQGKKACEPLVHSVEIRMLACSAAGSRLAFIDRNDELWVCELLQPSAPSRPVRLAAAVSHARWSDSHEVLAAIQDGAVRVFFLPQAAQVDPDCAAHTAVTLQPPPLTAARGGGGGSSSFSSLGRHSSLLSFSMSGLTLRASDGTLLALSVPVFPLFLLSCAAKGEWSRALRLCRLLPASEELSSCWSLLYGLSVAAGQLDAAQQSAAAMDWSDKLRSLQRISQMPSEAARQGSLAAFQRQFAKAESLFLASQLLWRAISLALDRCRWSQALRLACRHQSHIDTVLLARRSFLQQLDAGGGGQQETLPDFIAMQDVQVDAAAVAAKLRAETGREEGRQQLYQSQLRSRTACLADLFTAQQQQPVRLREGGRPGKAAADGGAEEKEAVRVESGAAADDDND